MAELQRIKELAREKGVTLKSLSESVGITQEGMSKIMRDNNTTTKTLEKICSFLGCSSDELLGIERGVKDVHYSAVGSGANNIVGGDVSKALDILKEQLDKKDAQIDGLIKALGR